MNPHWVLRPAELHSGDHLARVVLEVHRQIHQRHFTGSPGVNEALGLEVRACRTIESWQALLLLTPWMLSRLWFPERPPGIEIPPEWHAHRRDPEEYRLLGPPCTFEVLGQRQRAHLNFHRELGHYLLQPLALNMRPYPGPEAVFEEWNRVIRVRDENLRKMARDCPLQKEISRRELFRRLRG